MFQYFQGSPIAGQTQHFIVTFADETDTDAYLRAQAILATCEADLAILQSWFCCVFNASNAIWVHVAPGVEHGGAGNYGYNSTGSSQIIIIGTLKSPTPIPNPVFNDYARMAFVAELAEILMGYTQYGWQAGNSAGEALSRVAAAELHPVGYEVFGQSANTWLQAVPRPDRVSAPEDSDKHAMSIGCGILFIYFLAYQLGFSFPQIVTAGGSSLAQTFAKLTNQPAANAIASFSTLINNHLPVGETVNVPQENIFPLLDGAHRHLWFGNSEVLISSALQPNTHEVTLEVCRGAPQQYSYTVNQDVTQITLTAKVHGYADATFEWSVNGTPLPLSSGSNMVPATVPITLTDTIPLSDEQPIPTSLSILYSVSNAWNTSTLQVRNNNDFPGNATITITAQAREALIGNDVATAHTETVPFPMLDYTMESKYWTDLFRCRYRVVNEMAHSVAVLAESVIILKNAPDPSPEQMEAVSALATRYARSLHELTGGVIGLRRGAAALANRMRTSFNMPRLADLPATPGGLPVLIRSLPGKEGDRRLGSSGAITEEDRTAG
jgi:hypothetical protein